MTTWANWRDYYAHKQPRNDDSRNLAMWLLREQGWSYEAIGRGYGITGQAVRLTCQRYEQKQKERAMFTSERERISNELDDLWERMEALVAQRQTASYECWADIDTEYIELEGRYHSLLDRLESLGKLG